MTTTSSDTPTAPRSFWRPFLIIAGRFVLASVQLYALLIIAYLILRVLSGDRWQPVNVFTSLMPMPILPAIALCLIFLILRRWRTTLLLTPGVLAFLILYGGLFIGNAASIQDAAPRLRLMSYNIKTMRGGNDAVIALVRASDADIVAIQELHQDGAALLDAEFANEYPYRALHTEGNTLIGVGILSRIPIVSSEYWRLSMSNQRVELEWTLDAMPQRFVLYNLHPLSPQLGNGFGSGRSVEFDTILARSTTETIPTVLMGDFNVNDQNDDYAKFASRYQDSFREVGWGFGASFPYLLEWHWAFRYLPPIIRIDYVFHDANWQSVDAHVGSSSGGSDHYPLHVTLAFNPAG
ncbi:MAG: endonuclease/exonuclease/phosphatase family protein [Chloroflexota bacterium]|nr:endonuclease/exonuclease/phosphatase family protein [Chloroflexota bacterium]